MIIIFFSFSYCLYFFFPPSLIYLWHVTELPLEAFILFFGRQLSVNERKIFLVFFLRIEQKESFFFHFFFIHPKRLRIEKKKREIFFYNIFFFFFFFFFFHVIKISHGRTKKKKK